MSQGPHRRYRPARNRAIVITAAAAASVLGFSWAANASAVTATWVGNAPITPVTLWSAPDNWDIGAVPPSDADVVFGKGFGSSFSINIFGSNPVHTLTVDTDQPIALLSTDPLQYRLLPTAIARTTASNGTQTISAPIALTSNFGITTGGRGQLVISGPVAGAFAMKIDGNGSVELSGSNGQSETNVVSGASLVIPSNVALGPTTSALTLSDGTLISTAGFDLNRPVTLGSGIAHFAPVAGGTLNIVQSIANSGATAMYLDGAGSVLLFSSNSAPLTRINSGTLAAPLSDVAAPGATLEMAGGAMDFQLSSGNTGRPISLLSAGTFVIRRTVTFTGPVSGTGSLFLTGSGTMILNSSNSYTGGTVLQEGTLQISTDAGLGAATASLELRSGATFQTTTPITFGRDVIFNGGRFENTSAGITHFGLVTGTGLTMRGSGTTLIDHLRTDELHLSMTSSGTLAITANGTASGIARVGTLDLGTAGARFDLTNNSLILDYTGGSPFSDIRTRIITGYDAGDWIGHAFMSSNAAAARLSAHRTGLGYAEASSLNLGSFGGESIDNTTTLVRYTYLGDTNLDGVVNALDFNALASHYGAFGTDWIDGDFDYNASTNSMDFNALAANYNLALPSFGPLGVMVPEPLAVMTGSVILMLTIFSRTRKNH